MVATAKKAVKLFVQTRIISKNVLSSVVVQVVLEAIVSLKVLEVVLLKKVVEPFAKPIPIIAVDLEAALEAVLIVNMVVRTINSVRKIQINVKMDQMVRTAQPGKGIPKNFVNKTRTNANLVFKDQMDKARIFSKGVHLKVKT